MRASHMISLKCNLKYLHHKLCLEIHEVVRELNQLNVYIFLLVMQPLEKSIFVAL